MITKSTTADFCKFSVNPIWPLLTGIVPVSKVKHPHFISKNCMIWVSLFGSFEVVCIIGARRVNAVLSGECNLFVECYPLATHCLASSPGSFPLSACGRKEEPGNIGGFKLLTSGGSDRALPNQIAEHIIEV